MVEYFFPFIFGLRKRTKRLIPFSLNWFKNGKKWNLFRTFYYYLGLPNTYFGTTAFLLKVKNFQQGLFVYIHFSRHHD
jgi:hypothetical protein